MLLPRQLLPESAHAFFVCGWVCVLVRSEIVNSKLIFFENQNMSTDFGEIPKTPKFILIFHILNLKLCENSCDRHKDPCSQNL